MPLLGTFCLLFALALAAYTFVVGVVAAVRKDLAGSRLAETARRAGMACFVAVLLAGGALVYAALTNDFSVAYVKEHSNRALPLGYKLAVLWSGQEGSILFWCLLLSAYGFVLRLRHKVDQRLVAMASMVLAGIQVFFLILVNFVANPFGIMDRVVADGNGLNPLLQYPEMVIHPPMLYLGYVGVSVPFAFALAALIMRYPGEKWIHITRRWTMVAWLFLTFGIFLGAHWAYNVLGWGGYWEWDPVENASLLPWISTTAFLHSVMMQEKRGMMKVWNCWLIFITFMLSILGTMLTRSGMVNSVHAFAQSSIGPWFAGDYGWLGTPWHSMPYAYPGFLEIIFAVCLWVYIKNSDHLKSENTLESLVSRESSFLFNNLVLMGACFAVLCGTLFPILSDWIRGYKITVGAPFFNTIMVPIALFLVFLTAVGPLLAWRNTSLDSAIRAFAVPAVISLAVEVVLAVVWIKKGIKFWQDLSQIYALLAFCLSTLVITTIASEFIRGGRVLKGKLNTNIVFAMYHLTRRNMRRYGGYIVHFGIVVLVVGVSGLAFNQEQEHEMGNGDKLQIGHYTLVGHEYTQDDNANYVSEAALLDVYKDGKFLTRLNPERRAFKANGGQSSTIPAKWSTLREDLYVIYAGLNPDTGHPIIKAFVNPLVNWVWIGVLIMTFGTGLALVPNAAPITARVPQTAAVSALEKQGMQPAGVGK
jgi:cytochrome c-type biogenesis protein CcmF